MDFSLTEEQRDITRLVRDLLTAEATPEHLASLEAVSWSIFDRPLWQQLAQAGAVGIALPDSVGGSGQDFLTLALVLEEIGRAVAPVPAVATLVTSYVLATHAPDLAPAGVLAAVAAGEVLLTTAFAEPGDTELLAPATTATPDGAQWLITGEKSFVPYGADADWIVLPVSTPDGPGVALLAADDRAVEVTRLDTTNREPQATLTLTRATIPAAQLLTGPAATDLLTALRQHTTAGLCSVVAGACSAALRMTAAYATTREQFGKPIGSFQAVGQRAADAYIDAELVQLTARQAAWRLSEGWPVEEELAVAKFWAGDGGSRCVHACQHLHGGMGADLDYPLHRYFLWVKQAEHELGTPTRQLLTLGALLAATPV